ncbi:MAG: hypothetical protein GX589_07855 [Deltaproteobacteria bacterium]|nr:hypothetical protein [Deltaproteobacteria bacterium]
MKAKQYCLVGRCYELFLGSERLVTMCRLRSGACVGVKKGVLMQALAPFLRGLCSGFYVAAWGKLFVFLSAGCVWRWIPYCFTALAERPFCAKRSAECSAGSSVEYSGAVCFYR